MKKILTCILFPAIFGLLPFNSLFSKIDNSPPIIQIVGNAGKYDNIKINFILIDDESDLIDLIRIRYKKQTDTLWTPATIYGRITDLSSGPFGEPGFLLWKSEQDQPDQKGYYDFTITPMDSNIGTTDTWRRFLVDNQSPLPDLFLETPVGEQSGDITINFVIKDPYSEPHFVSEFLYSINGGIEWSAAHYTGAHVNLPSSPEGIRHALTWHSRIDIDGVDSDKCSFRMTFDTGQRSATGIFYMDNNIPPAAPTALQPADSTELKADDLLSWRNSYDPENDTLAYSLRIDNNHDFSSPTVIEDNIPQRTPDSTVIRLSRFQQFDNLLDNSIYFWKVLGQ